AGRFSATARKPSRASRTRLALPQHVVRPIFRTRRHRWCLQRTQQAGLRNVPAVPEGGTLGLPTKQERGKRTLIFSAASRASRFPHCCYAMPAAYWSSGLVHNGRRRRHDILTAMAEPSDLRRLLTL